MTTLHIPIFHGIRPRRDARKLDPSEAQIARNCQLFSEALEPLKDSIQVNTPTKPGTKLSIYLLQNLWLSWTTDVDVVRSPIYPENESRIYFTGDGNPKSTDTTLAATGGTNYPMLDYRLGIPQPDTAPTVNHTGGTLAEVERSYVYTFVSTWGEEGPPSPAGTHQAPSDATSWDITTLDGTPANQWTHAAGDIASIVVGATAVTITFTPANIHLLETTEYVTIAGTITGTGTLPTVLAGTWQITRVSSLIFTIPLVTTGTYTGGAVINREAPINNTGWTKRLYRTLDGNFRLVASDISGTTYTDTTADADLAELLPGGLVEESWWKAPNGDMKGIKSFPGGILVGFFGNTVAMSAPGIPSAWPEANQYVCNNTIVGIGVVGNTVVVATDGFPTVIVGDNPAAMVMSDLEIRQSCVSKRGLVEVANGVIYPSPDGLVYVPSVGLPQIITEGFMKEDEWSLFNPSSIMAGVYNDRYYGFYTGGGEGNNESGGFIWDQKEPGATLTTISTQGTAVYSDLETDSLYIVENNNISQWDSGGFFLTYTWLSKMFTTAYPVNFKAMKVRQTRGDGVTDAEKTAAIAAAIGALEAALGATVLDTIFGADNNYYSGAFGGFAPGEYAVAGGPYTAATAAITSNPVTANLRLYAHYDNGNGAIERHLVHIETLTGLRPVRVGNQDKGFLSDTWEVECNGNDVIITEVQLGTTMRALAAR